MGLNSKELCLNSLMEFDKNNLKIYFNLFLLNRKELFDGMVGWLIVEEVDWVGKVNLFF